MNRSAQITRNPTENTGESVVLPLGVCGFLINGVAIYNAEDAHSYENEGVWY